MKIIFATNNLNKLLEIKALMPKEIQVISLKEIDCGEDIPETGTTLEANAFLKAHYIKKHYGFDCFADDTGLEIEALKGAPGIYSARYAGTDRSAEANIKKVLIELHDKQNRKAQFRTAIALIINGQEHLFEGIVKGQISKIKKGENGFGYDPIFIPENETRTFAQMTLDEKSKISHRGHAFNKLLAHLHLLV